ncbi:MAG: YheT family hydrolase [Gammaproteobacteria bacterium]
MPAAADSFRRPWWLCSAHAETVAALYDRGTLPYQNDVAKTPDGDEVLLSRLPGRPGKPLLVVFHGLEGCAQSRTVRAAAAFFAARHWTVAAPHFRSCGRMNILPRAYHAADGADVRWFMEYFRAENPGAPMFAAGVSLGGNALIRGLAGENAPPVRAAATISAPLNLPAAARRLSRGVSHLIYGRHFVKLLRDKVRQKQKRYPAVADEKQLRAVRNIGDFDRVYTAPVHGFANAEEYWREGSAETALLQMKTPLLCINAQNDPLVPANSLPQTASDKVVFCRPKHGGHGAFFGAPRDWLGQTLYDFFAAAEKV